MKLVFLLFFVLMIAVLATVESAEAVTMNFSVPAGEDVIKTIGLAVEDRVIVRFTVTGQADNTLYFSMTYPNGTLTEIGKTGSFSESFVSNADGNLTLRFSNVNSSEDKFVTMNYEVEHYVLGIPQMLFLTLVIALLCLAAVAAFVLMGRSR